MKSIAHIHNDFKEKFGIPRQSGIVNEAISYIIFEEEYRNPHSVRGLDGYSHIWLIFEFSEAKRDGWSATVRPPRLGGNRRMGVFATRSPFRPNPIGLSSVRLTEIIDTKDFGTVLAVAGADLLDGTPIYDIKPYLPYTDSHPEARGGFADDVYGYSLSVICDDTLLARLPEEKRTALIKILEQDPRPAYQNDDKRVYTFSYSDYEISFTVSGDVLTVTNIVS